MWHFRNDERTFTAEKFRPKSSFNPRNKDTIIETYLSSLEERLLDIQIPSKRYANFCNTAHFCSFNHNLLLRCDQHFFFLSSKQLYKNIPHYFLALFVEFRYNYYVIALKNSKNYTPKFVMQPLQQCTNINFVSFTYLMQRTSENVFFDYLGEQIFQVFRVTQSYGGCSPIAFRTPYRP